MAKTINNAKKITSVTINTDEENGIPLEIMAKAITQVSDAAQKILNSRLTKRAIFVLIKDSIPGNTVGLREIEIVLEHAANLENKFIKRKLTKK